jgi:predicted neuraminidase
MDNNKRGVLFLNAVSMPNYTEWTEDDESQNGKNMEVIVAYLTYKPVNFQEGLRNATADLSIPASIPTKRTVNKIYALPKETNH